MPDTLRREDVAVADSLGIPRRGYSVVTKISIDIIGYRMLAYMAIYTGQQNLSSSETMAPCIIPK
jgi:hypothetical protein